MAGKRREQGTATEEPLLALASWLLPLGSCLFGSCLLAFASCFFASLLRAVAHLLMDLVPQARHGKARHGNAGSGFTRTESRRDGTLACRDVEKIQLLGGKIPQEDRLPSRCFHNA